MRNNIGKLYSVLYLFGRNCLRNLLLWINNPKKQNFADDDFEKDFAEFTIIADSNKYWMKYNETQENKKKWNIFWLGQFLDQTFTQANKSQTGRFPYWALPDQTIPQLWFLKFCQYTTQNQSHMELSISGMSGWGIVQSGNWP